jgi:hypothetical protein
LRELIPAIKGQHYPAGVEEGDFVAARAEPARKAKRFVEA